MATRHQRNPSKPKLEVISRSPRSVDRTDTHRNLVYSRILLSLPDDEYDALLPHLEFVELRLHQRLHESPDGLEYGYFLNFGLTSLVIVTKDGRSVEVGIVGREGFVGTPIAAGLNRTPYRAVVQANGNGFRIKAEVLGVMLSSTPIPAFVLTNKQRFRGCKWRSYPPANGYTKMNRRWQGGCSCGKIGIVL